MAAFPEFYCEDIPALAGNTRSPGRCPAGCPDHPRSRGEYASAHRVGSLHQGSSPLSRGIPARLTGPDAQAGIIPALAGNTGYHICASGVLPDHPRSRGEYRTPERCKKCAHGSSPLSRGIRWEVYRVPPAWGIIPALAGNTPHPAGWGPHQWDHPRSRGEYSSCIGVPMKEIGSSPLSRGILCLGWY